MWTICLHTHKSEVNIQQHPRGWIAKGLWVASLLGVGFHLLLLSPPLHYVCMSLAWSTSLPIGETFNFLYKEREGSLVISSSDLSTLSKLQTTYLDMSRPGEKTIGFFDLRHCISTCVGKCKCILLVMLRLTIEFESFNWEVLNVKQ